MIRRPPRPPIKMMQPIALDLANSVTLLEVDATNPQVVVCTRFCFTTISSKRAIISTTKL